MYTGRKAGSSYGDGVSGATFKSITDNPNGGSYAFASYYSGSIGINSFFVAADGTGYFKGNVGIGITSPAAKLDLYSVTDLGSTANGIRVNRPASYGQYGYLEYLVSSDQTVLGSVYSGGGASAFGQLYFRQHSSTTSRDAMVIKADGNVGIGTTSPGYKLQVNGDIYANGGYLRVGGTNGLYFESYGGGWFMSDSTWVRTHASKNVWTGVGLLGSDGGLTVGYGGNSPTSLGAIISGSVGIGTSSPANRFEVVGSTFNRASFIATANVQTGIQIQRTGGVSNTNWEIYSPASSGDLRINNVADYVTFKSGSGWVGIGTTSPADKLQVGTGHISIDAGYKYYMDANVGAVAIRKDGTSMVFTVGATDKVYINESGNVGIGTSSPATKLDVKGNVFVANAADGNNTIAFGNIGGLGPLNGAPDNLNGSAFLVVSSSTASGAPSHMKFYTTTGGVCGERMRIESDGNVSIGTTSAAYKLDVNGTFRATGTATLAVVSITGTINSNTTEALRINNNSGYISIYNTTGTTRTGYIQGTTANALTLAAENGSILQFNTSGSEKVRIDTVGNVGIGTTSPGYKLDVNGTFRTATNNLTIFNDYLYVSPTQNNTLNSAYFTNGIADMWINYAGYNNGNTQFRNFNVGDGKNGIVAWFDGTNKRVSINNSQTANYTLEVNGIIGLYGASNNHRRLAQPSVWGYSSTYRTIILGSTSTTTNVADGAVTLCFGVDVSANANGSFQGDGRELVFRNLTRFVTPNAANTSYLNPLTFNNGDVGIGTDSPVAKFEMFGGEMAIKLSANTTSSFQWKNSSGTKIQEIRYDDSDGSMTLGGVGGYPIKFITSNTEKVRISGTGNLGIGTTSPATLLHVDTAGSDARIRVSAGTNTVQGGMIANTGTSLVYAGSITNHGFSLRTNDTDRVRIQTDGNVGIGITSPTVKLTVSADVTDADVGQLRLVGSTSSAKMLSLGYQTTSNYGFISALIAGTGYSNLALQPNGGNVGIGSTSPGYKLDVVGDINFSSTLKLGGVDVISNSSSDVYINGRVIRNASTSTQDGMYIGYNSGGTTGAHIRFYANAGNERMRIQANDGNVGIGTTSAGKKLDVEGVVRTRGASGTGGFEIGAATTGTAKWRIEWDSVSDSLDFNWVG